MIGTAAHQDFNIYSLDFDVIGQVDTSPCGNLILRIGHTSVGEDSWEFIAHVTLTPAEVEAFIADIKAKMTR